MKLADYDAVCRIWKTTEGMCMEDDDRRERIFLYLRRNAGLCFVAVDAKKIIGTVLCGHDGRRGIMRHLAVLPKYRGQGIGKKLVRVSLDALAAAGILKCNIFVMDDNVAGMKFWEHLDFVRLADNYRTLQHGTGKKLRR